MSNLGISSAISAYSGQDTSVYGSKQLSSIEKKQQNSDEKNLSPNLKPADDIEDTATVSDEAKNLLANEQSQSMDDKNLKSQETQESTDKTGPKSEEKLTQEQEDEVAKLKAADIEVKAHEQAHIAAAAGISASAPSYSYKTGPDGNQYAVAGEVNISFPMSSDPEENLQNAETMKAAALAPADPSGQDYSVAANAEKIIAEARQQISEQEQQPSQDSGSTNDSDSLKKSELDKKEYKSDNLTNDLQNPTQSPSTSTAMKMISV